MAWYLPPFVVAALVAYTRLRFRKTDWEHSNVTEVIIWMCKNRDRANCEHLMASEVWQKLSTLAMDLLLLVYLD